MTMKAAVVGLGILGALVMGSGPARAQVQADTNELHVYAGELFGDNLTDRKVCGEVPKLDDGGSFTLNAGIGVKFFATKAFMIRGEARYRYIDSLLEKFDDSLNTVETTAGVGWKF